MLIELLTAGLGAALGGGLTYHAYRRSQAPSDPLQLDLQLAAASLDQPLVIVGPTGTILHTNQAFHEQLEVLEPLQGIHYWHSEALLGELEPAERTTLEQARQLQQPWHGELRLRRQDGSLYPCALSLRPNLSNGHWVALYHDLSASRAVEAQLFYHANYDDLTSLPNRQLALDRLAQVIHQADRYQQRVAVFLIDLDRFKQINDSLDHRAGDQLLKVLAERLQRCVREEDTLARLGGDEFLLIAGNVGSHASVVTVAKKLLATISQPVQLDEEHRVELSASIGIALFPSDGQSAEELLRNADSAMYANKEQGGNRYFFYTPALNELALKRLTLENHLRQAVQRNELSLVFQPQIDVLSGELVAAEALVRWYNPELGQIPPGEFIQIAEEVGLILPIGDWIMEEACRQLALWRAQGLPDLRMAINVSSRQFLAGHLHNLVQRCLDRFQLPGDALELEITEGILLENSRHTRQIIQRLKSAGVRLALDDFGTGYSSLSYLQRLPFDLLKIDRSFISGIDHDSANHGLVRAIIAMANSLGLEVLAEGIETEAERDILLQEGCCLMQGYWFSRPLPASSFQSWALAFSSISGMSGIR